MKHEKFKKLLEQIENNSFTDRKLSIKGNNYDATEEQLAERLGNKGAIILSQVLKKNLHIKSVELFFQNIGDIGVKALAEVDTLEELYLGANNIKLGGAIALAQTKLKLLFLEENNLCTKNDFEISNDDQISTMVEAFIENKTIIQINLAGNNIPAKYIAQLIGRNTTIKELLIYENYLTDEALEYIQHNKALEYLNISTNKITDKGTEYLSNNTSLKVLVISRCKVTDKGTHFLSIHPTLKELEMIDNDITIKGLKYILFNTRNKKTTC